MQNFHLSYICGSLSSQSGVTQRAEFVHLVKLLSETRHAYDGAPDSPERWEYKIKRQYF